MAVVAKPAPAPAPSRTPWETIYWGEGWAFIEKDIDKLKNLIEGKPDAEGFSSGDLVMLYPTVHIMAVQWPHDYAPKLYDEYGKTINEYLKSEVLPSLTNNEFMLEELVQRWSSHKLIVHWLVRVFRYLERGFIPRRSLATLKEVAIISFQQLIYKEIKGKIKNALIATIKKKQEEEQIDTFLKEVLDTFVEIKCYDIDSEDFGHILLKVTKHYCTESQKWIKGSYTHYIIKAEEHLRNLDGDQLKSSFKEIQYLLFTQQYQKQVLEEVLFALLCDGKAEDLSKTYRFFESRDNLKELEEVFSKLKDSFSKHLSDKVRDLFRQAKDSTSNKKVLLWKFIGLHEIEYFNGLTKIFFMALQKSVSCSLSAQFFDTIRKNIWKDQSGMLRKEAEEMYQEVKGKVKYKLIALLRKQRKQGKIIEDGKVMMPLLSKVLGILWHMKPDCFTDDIVNPLINSTKDDYSEEASSLILQNLRLEDYMTKVHEYVALEEEQSRLYLPSDEDIYQMIQEVKNMLFGSYSDWLLRDCKAEDLSRLFIRCSQICGLDQEPMYLHYVEGLWAMPRLKFEHNNNQDAESNEKVSSLLLYISDKDHLANIFREKVGATLQETLAHLDDKDISRMFMLFPKTIFHMEPFVGMFKMLITKGITELVKQKEGPTTNKESFVWQVSALRYEYKAQVIRCFQDHASFHETIEDTFRFAFNDGDLATLVVEILADALCDIILKKADSDEAINMVSRLLEYISDLDHFANICREKLVGRLQGSFADFRDENLSKTYRLFSKIIGGQEPFVGMFKTCLTNKIMEMIKQAEVSARYKEGFAREVSALRDKYKARAKRYFQDHASFHETIEDAFKLAFNDGDLATLVIEILVDAWCDIILIKAHSDEPINMVSRLLEYISHRDHFANICREKLVGRLQESFADLHDEDLSKTYGLFSKIIGGQEPFVGMFTTCLTNKIIEMVKQANVSASYKKDLLVLKIIELHDKFMKRVAGCFGDHRIFHKALDKVFEEDFFNKDVSGTSTAQLLANFCDNILKKGLSKTLTDKETKDGLDKAVKLLPYIDRYNGDLFAKICWKHLADRLLSKQSANDYELERSFVGMLKEYGLLITLKMNTMISDITAASDSQTKFQDFIAENPELNPGIDLAVTVLSKWAWPRYETFDIKFPDEMANCLRPHEEYHQKHGRSLSWTYSSGNCTIRATFGTKKYDLIVKPIQAAVLDLFNASDSLTCSEIAKELKVTVVDDIKPWLQSLSCAEYQILNKGAPGTISDDDKFTFNSDFDAGDKKTIEIPLPPDPADNTIDASDVRIMKKRKPEDMGDAIDASIVRVMKKRKTRSHKELVLECVEELINDYNFEQPDTTTIKKRISSLIDREYIKRAKDDQNTYHYVP